MGKDTTKIQFNIYKDGNSIYTNWLGQPPPLIDLGFDAADSFNDYAFHWYSDKIEWYVNGALVYTQNWANAIPTQPGQLMMNLWNGDNSNQGLLDWCGLFDINTAPVYLETDYMRVSPF